MILFCPTSMINSRTFLAQFTKSPIWSCCFRATEAAKLLKQRRLLFLFIDNIYWISSVKFYFAEALLLNLDSKLRIVMQHQFFRNSQNRSRCLIWKCRAWRIADAGVIWSNNQFSGFQPRPHLTCYKILSSQHRLCCHTWKCRV